MPGNSGAREKCKELMILNSVPVHENYREIHLVGDNEDIHEQSRSLAPVGTGPVGCRCIPAQDLVICFVEWFKPLRTEQLLRGVASYENNECLCLQIPAHEVEIPIDTVQVEACQCDAHAIHHLAGEIIGGVWIF